MSERAGKSVEDWFGSGSAAVALSRLHRRTRCPIVRPFIVCDKGVKERDEKAALQWLTGPTRDQSRNIQPLSLLDIVDAAEPVEAGAVYCPSCHSPLVRKATPPPPSGVEASRRLPSEAKTVSPAFCSKCGNSVQDGAAFCASCGNPLTGTPPPPVMPVRPYPAPGTPTATATAPTYAYPAPRTRHRARMECPSPHWY